MKKYPIYGFIGHGASYQKILLFSDRNIEQSWFSVFDHWCVPFFVDNLAFYVYKYIP